VKTPSTSFYLFIQYINLFLHNFLHKIIVIEGVVMHKHTDEEYYIAEKRYNELRKKAEKLQKWFDRFPDYIPTEKREEMRELEKKKIQEQKEVFNEMRKLDWVVSYKPKKKVKIIS